ncbi:ABC transporter permease [Ornatilinea apprima]|uniref:ABC transporter permease n=1 Tax=Ornatilinea apprima TaxID=1134406 RepID=UPI00094612E3|nr:ABC transporter permease [Ornatilinea apprima]
MSKFSPKRIDSQKLVYYRDLVLEMISRDLKLRYKGSLLGVIWSLLLPLTQLLVFTFLFRRVIQLDIPNYPIFVFIGVLAWNWFQTSLVAASGSITDNRDLIKRPGFPTLLLPVITVATNLIQFLLALPVLLVFLYLSGGQLTLAFLLLPLILLIQFLFTVSLGYLTATFQVSFRDTQHLLGVVLLLLFYLTPVFYDAGFVPTRFLPIYRLNPMMHIIGAYRNILSKGEPPDFAAIGIVFAASALLLWIGLAVFRRASDTFVEEL